MSMRYIRDYYRVPAKRGGRVRVQTPTMGQPKDATILSAPDQYLWLRFDGQRRRSGPWHPTWCIEYLST